MADRYARQGYQVVVRPGADRLPPFARDFQVELVGTRGGEGVLVTVKQNRDELSADPDLPRYAELTAKQPGWRFDLAVLEGQNPAARDFRGATDFSPDEIAKSLADAEHLAGLGFTRAAVMTAWSALEAAMRMRLRKAGEKVGSGTSPREIMNELYSTGVLSETEFRRLDDLARLRSQIVHGFSFASTPNPSGPDVVQFLSEVTHRLVEESELAELTA